MKKTIPLRTAVVIMLGLIAALILPQTVGQSKSKAQVFFAPSGAKRELHRAIMKKLSGAKKSVIVAMFQWTSKPLGERIISLSKKIDVRVLLDEDQLKGSWSQAKDLKKAGVEIRYLDLPGSGYQRVKMHHKFLVVDQRTVVTGSMNWTIMADERNHEALLVISDPYLARDFTVQFEKLWKEAKPWK